MANDNEETSLAHAVYLTERDLFERDFERVLTATTIPIEKRREIAIETIRRLGAIGRRLHASDVL